MATYCICYQQEHQYCTYHTQRAILRFLEFVPQKQLVPSAIKFGKAEATNGRPSHAKLHID